MYQHNLAEVGEYDVYLHVPHSVPKLVALLNLVESNEVKNTELPLIFKYAENQFLVPIDSKCSAAAGFSASRIDR